MGFIGTFREHTRIRMILDFPRHSLLVREISLWHVQMLSIHING